MLLEKLVEIQGLKEIQSTSNLLPETIIKVKKPNTPSYKN